MLRFVAVFLFLNAFFMVNCTGKSVWWFYHGFQNFALFRDLKQRNPNVLVHKIVTGDQNGLKLLGLTVATDETDGFKRFMRSAGIFDIPIKVRLYI